MRDFPNLTSRGREGKKDAPIVPNEDIPKTKARFYALRARGSKSDENDDDDVGK